MTAPESVRGFRMRVVPDGYAPGLDRCDMRLELRGERLPAAQPRAR